MIKLIQAMQRRVLSEGELRLSSEPSNITCGFSVSWAEDTPSSWKDTAETLRSATSLAVRHPSPSSFLQSPICDSFLTFAQQTVMQATPTAHGCRCSTSSKNTEAFP